MKIALIISMVTSALLAGIVETNNGMFLELFSYKNSTELVSKVPIFKGKIEKRNCFSTRNGQEWCKVTYSDNGMIIKGYSEKKYLDLIAQAPNNI